MHKSESKILLSDCFYLTVFYSFEFKCTYFCTIHSLNIEKADSLLYIVIIKNN